LKYTAKHGTKPRSIKKDWMVYIILCDDNSLYTGVTTELERRFQEHLNHPRGAKYFNGRKPLEVVYCENDHTRSSALQREAAIKKLSREEKLRLIT
jgi:putative endonuclease